MLVCFALQSTQISDADPRTCKRAHTFLIKTVSLQGVSEHTLAADSKDELNKWWDGFQQHLLDQGVHAFLGLSPALSRPCGPGQGRFVTILRLSKSWSPTFSLLFSPGQGQFVTVLRLSESWSPTLYLPFVKG